MSKKSYKSKKYYKQLVEEAGIAILIDDEKGNFRFGNKKFAELFGYSTGGILKKSIKDIVHPDDVERVMEIHRTRVRGEKVPSNYEFKGITKDKKPIWLEIHAEQLREKDKIVGTRSFIWEITDRKKKEEYMVYLAYHDVLTGLANRWLLYDKFDSELTHISRHNLKDILMSVMYLDLDYFKDINDNLGHNTGDMLLRDAARKLEKCVRKGDTLARLGGDEFLILYTNVTKKEDIKFLADKVYEVFQKPFNISNKKINMTTSMGISVYPNDSEEIEQLIDNADKALYVAKRKGRNRYEFFSQ
ncbi:MAG: GGDEF domain-containing protein [Candidatus Pacearchaeota archaeon]|nr:MAG: GGDEF domain-containing protein [Candidatus Pacearchaeota archaeon]